MLLMVLSIAWTSHREVTELQNEIQQEEQVCSVIRSEYPTTEKAIAHHYAEQVAIPFSAVIELSGQHLYSSKSKSMQTNIQNNRHVRTLGYSTLYNHTPIPYHVIDYYIYTLEHILI